MPRDFIQAAERNNEMHEVDMWVIRNSLDWMAKHRSKVDGVGGYSINLSGLTLGDDSLLRYVLERLTESQVPPSKIIFEVTESAAINTLSVAVNFINTLKEYGCRFALDDFGTGDASFAYLKTLPIDFVKIDGSIVRDIVDSPKDLALVKSINEIGHFLGKKTVAEFVENDDILARLRQMGVDYAQGYGIEAPFTPVLIRAAQWLLVVVFAQFDLRAKSGAHTRCNYRALCTFSTCWVSGTSCVRARWHADSKPAVFAWFWFQAVCQCRCSIAGPADSSN